MAWHVCTRRTHVTFLRLIVITTPRPQHYRRSLPWRIHTTVNNIMYNNARRRHACRVIGNVRAARRLSHRVNGGGEQRVGGSRWEFTGRQLVGTHTYGTNGINRTVERTFTTRNKQRQARSNSGRRWYGSTMGTQTHASEHRTGAASRSHRIQYVAKEYDMGEMQCVIERTNGAGQEARGTRQMARHVRGQMYVHGRCSCARRHQRR